MPSPRPGAAGQLEPGRSRWLVRRAARRLRVACFWQARADLEEAARDAHHAQALLRRCRAAPVGLAAEVALVIAEIERDRDRPDAARGQLDHALALLEPLAGDAVADQLLARTLIALGDCHRRAGRHLRGRAHLERALAMVDRDGGSLNLLGAALALLGITAKEWGEYDLAAGYYARVEEVYRVAGASKGESATLQHNLAGLEYARGNHVEAEAHARLALALRRQVPKVAPVEVAADLAVLGSAVAGQRRHPEARALFQQALSICRAARPPREYEIAVHLHNLADIDQASGRLSDAERHYREALEIKERLLGELHPEVGVVANNLATLLHDVRPAEAARWYERAVEITQAAYPPTHFIVTRVRGNLDRLRAREEEPG